MIIGTRGPRGLPGKTPVKGVDYFDGKDGKDGAKGDKGDPGESIKGPRGDSGKDGRDGIDGKDGKDGSDADIAKHESEFDHNLLHDPKILGTIEVDETGKGENKILKYREGKLVYSDLPRREGSVMRGGGATQYNHLVGTIETKTSDYTLTHKDYIIWADATSGAITVTLPPASTTKGRVYVITKTDSSANTVTIDPDGSDQIFGETTFALVVELESVTISTDGTSWNIAG